MRPAALPRKMQPLHMQKKRLIMQRVPADQKAFNEAPKPAGRLQEGRVSDKVLELHG
jgi:hypothetical protein